MLISVKNHLAKLDRLIGDMFFLRYFKFLQPPEDVTKYKVSNDEAITEIFPSIFNHRNKVNQYHYTFFEEYIIRVDKPLIIDSSVGWVYWFWVIPYFRSFPYAGYPWKDFLKPTFFWVQLKNVFKSKRKINPHFNLVWYGWENYYHFYWDIIPALILIKSSPYKEYPVLVPESGFNKKHVQDFLEMFHEFSFNFQPVSLGERLLSNHGLYFVKASRFQPSIIDLIASNDFLKRINSVKGIGIKKVFLYRPIGGLRSITNNDEVRDFLINLGFVAVDSSKMSLISQIELFKDVEFCVGVHGAGLNNLIFAKDGFRLIELSPSKSYQPDHYKLLSKLKYANYRLLVGSKPQEKLQFSVNILDLKLTIESE